MKTLFKNCNVLAKENGKYVEYTNAFLGVDGKVISYIGKEMPKEKYDLEKDMSGKLLMPGLVNNHGHSAMTLVRGAGSGLPLDRWLNEAIFPIEAKMTPVDIYNGDLIAIMEMLSSGTTQVADMYDFPYAGALAYARSGMKVNLDRVGLCFDPSLDPKDWGRTAEVIEFVDMIREGKLNAEAEKELNALGINKKAGDALSEEIITAAKDGIVKADLCLHSEYLTTEKFVRAIAKANETRHAITHVHISETKKEHEECIARHGKTPVAYLNDLGILDNPCYGAHCVWVTDEDMEIMAEKNLTMVHNPTSNLKLGSGIARVSKAISKGVNVSLGTDGVASNNNLNMFEEMHIAALLQKGAFNDPTLLSDETVLDMATVNGAKALGRPDTGSLEVGKKADIIALDMTGIHMLLNIDTKAILCFTAQGSDVVMTMVDGKVLYENGEFTTIDKEKALYEFSKSIERLK